MIFKKHIDLKTALLFTVTIFGITAAVLGVMTIKYKDHSADLQNRFDALDRKFAQLEKNTESKIEKTAGLMKFYRTEKRILDMRNWLKRDHIMVSKFLENLYRNANIYGVDPYTALAIATKESIRFEKANYRTRGTSGEIGWFQIMPSTAAGFGYSKNDLRKLENNVKLGVFYFSNVLKNSKNEYEALRKYNGGRKWKSIDITDIYARDVIRIKKMYQNFVNNSARPEKSDLYMANDLRGAFSPEMK